MYTSKTRTCVTSTSLIIYLHIKYAGSKNFSHYFFFQSNKFLKYFIINIIQSFSELLKIITFSLARCVFVPTNFSSFASKDSLAFFAKRDEKLRNLLFFSSQTGFNFPNQSKIFFFNLQRIQINPNYSYLAQTL